MAYLSYALCGGTIPVLEAEMKAFHIARAEEYPAAFLCPRCIETLEMKMQE